MSNEHEETRPRWTGSDDTQPVTESDDATRPGSRVDEPARPEDDWRTASGSTAAPVSTWAAGGGYPTSTVEAPRPAARGASWATVAFGLVCMTVAGLVLAFQLAEVRVDWEIAGPAAVVGLGLLLVLVGVVGLLTRQGDETG